MILQVDATSVFIFNIYFMLLARPFLGSGGFQKIGGTLFWGPYDKDPTILGTILGVPYFPKKWHCNLDFLPGII